MKIAVRMDDITRDMDWEKFNRFKALLDEYRINPLLGVVPDNRDENLKRDKKNTVSEEAFWQSVKKWQDEGWVIALHGYRHLYTKKRGGIFPLNCFSEFAGISAKEQSRMLARGKEIFEKYGIRTDIFMAPAHSYDKNTLKALKENGFLKITDGFGSRPYMAYGITFYPISFRLGSSLKRKGGTTTMVVHGNTVTEADMDRYSRIFAEEEMISYAEYLKEPAVKRGISGRFAEYILANIKRLLVKFL